MHRQVERQPHGRDELHTDSRASEGITGGQHVYRYAGVAGRWSRRKLGVWTSLRVKDRCILGFRKNKGQQTNATKNIYCKTLVSNSALEL
eukprot:1645618-Amphidinium_carterae.1